MQLIYPGLWAAWRVPDRRGSMTRISNIYFYPRRAVTIVYAAGCGCCVQSVTELNRQRPLWRRRKRFLKESRDAVTASAPSGEAGVQGKQYQQFRWIGL